MDLPAPVRPFWEAESANELADLVLRGDKRATAGLVWVFEAKARPFPNRAT